MSVKLVVSKMHVLMALAPFFSTFGGDVSKSTLSTIVGHTKHVGDAGLLAVLGEHGVLDLAAELAANLVIRRQVAGIEHGVHAVVDPHGRRSAHRPPRGRHVAHVREPEHGPRVSEGLVVASLVAHVRVEAGRRECQLGRAVQVVRLAAESRQLADAPAGTAPVRQVRLERMARVEEGHGAGAGGVGVRPIQRAPSTVRSFASARFATSDEPSVRTFSGTSPPSGPAPRSRPGSRRAGNQPVTGLSDMHSSLPSSRTILKSTYCIRYPLEAARP